MKKVIAGLLIAVLALGCFGLGYMVSNRPDTAVPPAEIQNTPVLAEKTGDDVKIDTAAQVTEPETSANSAGSENAPVPDGEMTLEQAKEIALADAGITEADASHLRGRLDYDDGKKIYDVEFYAGDTEYDYEILADSGEIYEKNLETRKSQPAGDTEMINLDAAKEIAANHAGISLENATFLKAELDQDDFRPEYEIEFFGGGRTYEYVIEPYTGEVLEAEIDA